MRKAIVFLIIISLFSVSVLAQLEGESSRKFKVEFSGGLSLAKPSQLFYRATAISKLMDHYTSTTGLTYNDSGSFKENMTTIPINLLIAYPIAESWTLLAGIEFTLGSNTSEKLFSVTDQKDFSEEHSFTLTNKINFFMPMAGVARNFLNFSIFSKLGFAFTTLNHGYTFNYSLKDYWHIIEHTYKVSGNGLALFLGCQYNINVMRKIELFFRLEFMYLNIGTLKGERESTATNEPGDNQNQTDEGTLYTYEINPYGQRSINYWDLHANAPQSQEFQNVNKMKLNLSSLRLTMGFRF